MPFDAQTPQSDGLELFIRFSKPRTPKTLGSFLVLGDQGIVIRTHWNLHFTNSDNFPVVSIVDSVHSFEEIMMMKLMTGLQTVRSSIFRRFVSLPPAKSDAICFGRVAGGLPEARSSIFRRFVSSSPAESVAIRCGRVSGGVAAEGLLFDEETTQATVVKSGVLPTLLQPRVVVYDGVCHLCHRGVKLVINADKDRRIKFCCLQSKAAEPYMRVCGVDREDVLRRFLFIEGPFEYHQGSSAALKVLSYLPLPYSALSTLMIIPAPIRDLAYDYIAKKRYDWFGKDTNCLVLKEKDLLERFIDRDEMVQKEWSDE
ncbi:hypothetical protein R6Q57_015100 [Mikania cordata]